MCKVSSHHSHFGSGVSLGMTIAGALQRHLCIEGSALSLDFISASEAIKDYGSIMRMRRRVVSSSPMTWALACSKPATPILVAQPEKCAIGPVSPIVHNRY